VGVVTAFCLWRWDPIRNDIALRSAFVWHRHAGDVTGGIEETQFPQYRTNAWRGVSASRSRLRPSTSCPWRGAWWPWCRWLAWRTIRSAQAAVAGGRPRRSCELVPEALRKPATP
jgi:hypothetical protein